MIGATQTQLIEADGIVGPILKKPSLILKPRANETSIGRHQFQSQPTASTLPRNSTYQDMDKTIGSTNEDDDGGDDDDIVDFLKNCSGRPWTTVINGEQTNNNVNETKRSESLPPLSGEKDRDIRDSNKNHFYGLYPEWDEFYLAVCDICGIIIRPQALEKHLKTKHQIGPHQKKIQQRQTSDLISADNKLNDPRCSNFAKALDSQAPLSNKLENNSDIIPTTVSASVSTKAHSTPAITIRTSTTITATSATNTLPIESIITPKVTNNNLAKLNGISPTIDISSKVKKSKKPSSDTFVSTLSTSSPIVAQQSMKKSLDKGQSDTKPEKRQQKLHRNNPVVKGSKIGVKQNAMATSPLQLEKQHQDNFLIDTTFYGFEPLSPPSCRIKTTSSTSKPTLNALSSSNNFSSASTSSSPSSTISLTSPSSTSTSIANHTDQSHQQLIILPAVSLFNTRSSIVNAPSQTRYHVDRKWRKTFNVLRDAFL